MVVIERARDPVEPRARVPYHAMSLPSTSAASGLIGAQRRQSSPSPGSCRSSAPESLGIPSDTLITHGGER